VFEGQKRKTVVIGVHWKASKHGKLAPRVQFEPVVIGGDTVEYATGFHGSYIMKNKIGEGAKITLCLSGDGDFMSFLAFQHGKIL
jgi:NAD-dependent DNA ligase